jgi:hypothetical protein
MILNYTSKNAALFFILYIFISLNCNENNIIEEDKFIQIYSDIIIANDTISSPSQVSDSILLSILNKHGETKDDYKATIEYYNEDSERWEKFFSKAVTYLEKKRKNSAK